jgi:hypothetical protein
MLAKLLLLDKSCEATLKRRIAGCRVVMPASMPPTTKAGQQERFSSPQVNVVAVELGTRGAWVVARQHLDDILHALVVRGMPVNIGAVQGAIDVADSEVVWEAVLLLRHTEMKLAATESK